MTSYPIIKAVVEEQLGVPSRRHDGLPHTRRSIGWKPASDQPRRSSVTPSRRSRRPRAKVGAGLRESVRRLLPDAARDGRRLWLLALRARVLCGFRRFEKVRAYEPKSYAARDGIGLRKRRVHDHVLSAGTAAVPLPVAAPLSAAAVLRDRVRGRDAARRGHAFLRRRCRARGSTRGRLWMGTPGHQGIGSTSAPRQRPSPSGRRGAFGLADRFQVELRDIVDDPPRRSTGWSLWRCWSTSRTRCASCGPCGRILRPGAAFIGTALKRPNADHIYLYRTLEEVMCQLDGGRVRGRAILLRVAASAPRARRLRKSPPSSSRKARPPMTAWTSSSIDLRRRPTRSPSSIAAGA